MNFVKDSPYSEPKKPIRMSLRILTYNANGLACDEEKKFKSFFSLKKIAKHSIHTMNSVVANIMIVTVANAKM